jgi:hypothetical protein
MPAHCDLQLEVYEWWILKAVCERGIDTIRRFRCIDAVPNINVRVRAQMLLRYWLVEHV